MHSPIYVFNPARISEVVGEVEPSSEEAIESAIHEAYQAFPVWSRTCPEDRAALLVSAAAALQGELPRLAVLFVRENGKPLREAERDLQRAIDLMQLVAAELPGWWSPELVDAGQPVWMRRRPRGVTSVISPWNSPVLLSFKRFVPALAAGNTVILKPASHCPLTISECVRIIAPLFPPGVIRVLVGQGDTVGERLATDPRIRAVAFTGSTETGRRIMELASRTLKKVFLELGGNDPALVFEDAELDGPAIQKMTSAVLRASGQVCVAVKRIYVHESRFDELVGKLEDAFDAVIVGDGMHPETTMGPLNNRSQFEFVSGLLSRCRARQLRVMVRGKQLDPREWNGGYFVNPAIVLGSQSVDEIVTCEQFGPVVPILTFSGEAEAVIQANQSQFGLRASVWTADRQRALRIADRLEAGAVFHNNHGIFQDLHLEFPGLKQSGFSRESRAAGLDHFADTYGFAD